MKRTAELNRLPAKPLAIDGIVWRAAEGEARPDGLRLAPGTVSLLMGRNGAGKSTLLEKLAGLRPPETLKIYYGEQPLWLENQFGRRRLNEKALHCYGYACQAPEQGLFARSVADELAYSLRPYRLETAERQARVTHALAAVGWDGTWLDRDPYLMSGGERRRAALAAVFATPADWVLLDEPTAGLDGAGHAQLAEQIGRLKASGTGVVLVSHDSDWAMPLADSIMILDGDGSIRQCGRDELLDRPEWLEEAGTSVPLWLETAHSLLRSGVPAQLLWEPSTAAAAASAVAATVDGPDRAPAASGAAGHVEQQSTAQASGSRSASLRKPHRLTAFDPRSVWLAYIVLSVGIFAQKSWSGLLLGGITAVVLLAAGRISLWRWRGLIVNFAVFSLVASAFFAVGAGNGGILFDVEGFTGTLFSFARTMVVMLLGLGLPLVMTPLSLRRALEQLLSFKGKTPAVAQRFILTVTLMMRFVPVLLQEWERFQRIFLARGKQTAARMQTIRRLRDASIPFLLALFRLGDEVALALESRGVSEHKRPTRTSRLRWRGVDYALVGGAALWALILWWIRTAVQ